MKTVTPAQEEILNELKGGTYIGFTGSIGSKYSASVDLIDANERVIKKINLKTFWSLIDNGFLQEFQREGRMRKYKLNPTF